MGLNIGANPISDMYVGGSACDRVYKGSDLLFDANSEVQGLSPIYFHSRANAALKNYRVYGVSGGAGVQTENLVDKDNLNIVKAYINSNDTIVSYNTNGLIYVPVVTGETYTISGFKRSSSATDIKWGITASIPTNNVSCTRVGSLNQSSSITVTITSGEAYLCIFLCGDSEYSQYGSVEQAVMKNAETGMIIPGSTAPASYIPFGYQIPLTVTSGVTENEFDSEIEQGNMYSGVDQPSTSENYYKRCRTVGYIDVEEGVTYTIKSSYNMWWYGYKNGVYFSGQGADQWDTAFTITPNSNYNQIRIMFANLDTTETLNISDFVNDVMLVKGSTAPDHYIPHRYTADYNLYIGDTQLGAEEYVDYQEQKVYKNVSGTLTPIEPPVPFPVITVYKGNNKISSSTAVGKIYVKGRISNQPLGYVMTQTTYDVLSPQQKYGNKYFAIYNSGTTGNVESVYNLTQTDYDALTEYDVTRLYIIETSGTISNAYVGANQLDSLYLGGTKIWNTTEYELPDWFPRIDVESIFAPYQSYSQYYYDFCCQKINTTDGTYAYVRIYCENASDGEIGLLDNAGVDTYFTWYTDRTGHRIVAYRFGGEYQPTFSQGDWTNNRQYATNYIGGNSKQAYSPKPCVIKKTMTRINFTGAITPDKIGF